MMDAVTEVFLLFTPFIKKCDILRMICEGIQYLHILVVLYLEVASERLRYFRSLILAIGVCYLARLEIDTRVTFADRVSYEIKTLFDGQIDSGSKYLRDQINR